MLHGLACHSLQCRRILGERNLFRVRIIVVATIFDFMTVEDWGRVEIVSLRVGARVKEGKWGGGGEKEKYACPITLFFWETLYAGKRSSRLVRHRGSRLMPVN